MVTADTVCHRPIIEHVALKIQQSSSPLLRFLVSGRVSIPLSAIDWIDENRQCKPNSLDRFQSDDRHEMTEAIFRPR
jgi:hypothetical protein